MSAADALAAALIPSMRTISRHQAGVITAGEAQGGRFAATRKTQAGAGAFEDTPWEPDPSEVVTAAFTVGMLRDTSDGTMIWGSDSATGHTLLTFENPPGERPMKTKIAVDQSGEIVSLLQGIEPDLYENPSMLDSHRHALRMERLKASGVNHKGAPNNGGHYGGRFTGAKRDEIPGGYVNAAEVSKLTRKGVKRAIEFGALPKDVKVSVTTDRYAGGQAVRIHATLPTGRVHSNEKPGEGYTHTAEARSVRDVLEAIGDQWNDTEIESMTDYYQTDYHLSVQLGERNE